jgi:DNA-binding transcriptional ArsR family regulator
LFDPIGPEVIGVSWAARLLSYNHMVVGCRTREEHADRIFRALADRTRRDIVRRAMRGTLSVSALARPYPMSTTAVQKHVAVLEEAGLVHQTRRGRENLVQTEIAAIAEAGRLLGEFEQLWRDRLERIDDVLAEPRPGGSR